MTINFDNAITTLCSTITTVLGAEELEDGLIVRDSSGQLCYFSSNDHSTSTVKSTEKAIKSALGRYARNDRRFVPVSEGSYQQLCTEDATIRIIYKTNSVMVLDRRLVGADWLRVPVGLSGPPPRFVFASIKGGVGRSTALCVCAAHLAQNGDRVLVIDVDLEAPGLGSMLLSPETLPQYGLVDLLVERSLGPLTDSFLVDSIGPSALSGGHGRIDVVPAFGKSSNANAEEVLGKLARAYLEDLSKSGKMITLFDKLDEIIRKLTALRSYDAVFIDARAGLHETNAAVLLGLGSNVFLFGLAENQHFQGSRYLLGGIARRLRTSTAISKNWIDRLTFVRGKASKTDGQEKEFSERCDAILSEFGLISPNNIENTVMIPSHENFGDIPWEQDALISDSDLLPELSISRTVSVWENAHYKNFDPIKRKELLNENLYIDAYGELIERILIAQS